MVLSLPDLKFWLLYVDLSIRETSFSCSYPFNHMSRYSIFPNMEAAATSTYTQRPSMGLRSLSRRNGYPSYPNRFVNGIYITPNDLQNRPYFPMDDSDSMRSLVEGKQSQTGRLSMDKLQYSWRVWMNSDAKNRKCCMHALGYHACNQDTYLTVDNPDFIAVLGEFIGTTMFLFFAFAGTQVAKIGAAPSSLSPVAAASFNPTVQLYIALSFGFSLMVNAWVFFRVTGGMFNPAVSRSLPISPHSSRHSSRHSSISSQTHSPSQPGHTRPRHHRRPHSSPRSSGNRHSSRSSMLRLLPRQHPVSTQVRRRNVPYTRHLDSPGSLY